MPERPDPLLGQLVKRTVDIEQGQGRQAAFDAPAGNSILLGEFSAAFTSTVSGTSGTYANVHGAGTTVATVTKRMDATDLLVKWIIAGSASGAPTDVRYAARVGGVDHGGWPYRYATNSDRRQVLGWARCPSVLSGTQSIELRYRIELGTSVNWNADTDAWGYEVWEIPAIAVA